MRNELMALLILLAASVAVLPGQTDTGAWDSNSKYNRKYSTNTVVTVQGKIIASGQTASVKNRTPGVHWFLAAGHDTIEVHLGPVWYISRQPVQFKNGEKVDVTGSKVMFNGKPVIIAREVSGDGKLLKLRDENGIPAWSGAGRKGN